MIKQKLGPLLSKGKPSIRPVSTPGLHPPDLNQLGLKAIKTWNSLLLLKIKITKIYFWLGSKSCIRQTKSVNMMRLILVDLIDIV